MKLFITDLEAYNLGHLIGQWYQYNGLKNQDNFSA